MNRVIYTALSRHSAYAKEIVCAHAFQHGAVPLNPFSMFGYFLFDMVDRDLVRTANRAVISRVDEVWSYGPIADGCLSELLQAMQENKPIRFFTVEKRVESIRELDPIDLEFESDELKMRFSLKVR